MCSSWIYVYRLYENNINLTQKSENERALKSISNDLEIVMNQTMTYVNGLKGFTYSQLESGFTAEEFNTYAKETQEAAFAVRNFSIAPGNIQKYVYPLEGNMIVKNHDLTSDERESVRNDVKKAMETGDIVISTPYILRQGGIGLTVRYPIFQKDKYWGLINVVIDVDKVVEEIDSSENNSMIIALASSEGKIFWGQEKDYIESNNHLNINVFDTKWVLSGTFDSTLSEENILKLNLFKIISFLGFFGMFTLIFAGLYKNKLLSGRVMDLIYKDELTGLFNRKRLVEHLEKNMIKGIEFSIVLIDLDDFKSINDTLGHNLGDEILKIISNRLKELEIKGVKVYRWGGDEFILVLNNKSSRDYVLEISKDVLENIKKTIKIFDNEYTLTFSAGIAIYPLDGVTVEEIIKHADMTMHYAKKQGKNKIEMYNVDLSNEIYKEYELEKKLKIALENDNLELYYQPQINIKENRIIGVEALIRWNHEGQFISPVKFIPIAEKSGLLSKLDNFVINESIRQVSLWNEKNINLKMSINISPSQFNYLSLDHIKEKLEKCNVSPAQLEVEITEQTAIENLSIAQELIKEFKRTGVEVSLDDFGTGYSSLSYLSQLEVSTLKIDQSFVSKMSKDNFELKIVKAIINLAQSMGLKTIAEGVEEKEQMGILNSLKCNIHQGYYYSRPVPPQQLEEWLEHENKKEESIRFLPND